MSGKYPMEGSIVMYGAPPIDVNPPGLPWIPDPTQPFPKPFPNPFTPGVQPVPGTLPQPPFTAEQGGPEPIEQIKSRIETRAAQLRKQIEEAEQAKRELAALEDMLGAFETWARSTQDPTREKGK